MLDNNNYLTDELMTTCKWLCHEIVITPDRQVYSLHTRLKLKERYHNGSIGYTVNGQFRTKKWINNNCVNIEGLIE